MGDARSSGFVVVRPELSVVSGNGSGFPLGPEDLNWVIDRTRTTAEKYSTSYRGFKVGAAVIGWTLDDCRVWMAANHKPTPEAPKICAETTALARAKAAGCISVDGLVVVGPSDPEEIEGVTGFRAETLPPCRDCSDNLTNHPLLKDGGSTPVLTTGLEEGDLCELRTVKEIAELYKELVINPLVG